MLRAAILDDLANEEHADLVSERDGRIVGSFQINPVEESSVHTGLARPRRGRAARLGRDAA